MADISKIQLPNSDPYNIKDAVARSSTEIIIGTQTAATNIWTGEASFSTLESGQTITYWLPYAGTSSSAFLNLTLADGTATGNVNVYINGSSRCTTHIAAGNFVQMVYLVNARVGSKTYTGWWINKAQDTTTNYYDRSAYKASVTSTELIAAGKLGVFDENGSLVPLGQTPFDITKPILYVGTAYTSKTHTNTNNYICWGTAFSLATTVAEFEGTAGATVYIKGTLSGNMLTPASDVVTCTKPSSDDGYVYMLLGLMSTATAMVLPPAHPMYAYKGGVFKDVIQLALEMSGVIPAERIGYLPASIITSGTLTTARIPDLDASKITSGTLDAARIPALSTDKITSGTLDAARLPASGVTAGSYGQSSNATPDPGDTFNVPYVIVDAKGRVTDAVTRTVTIPAYSTATTSDDGLMSATDKSKLNNITTIQLSSGVNITEDTNGLLITYVD